MQGLSPGVGCCRWGDQAPGWRYSRLGAAEVSPLGKPCPYFHQEGKGGAMASEHWAPGSGFGCRILLLACSHWDLTKQR